MLYKLKMIQGILIYAFANLLVLSQLSLPCAWCHHSHMLTILSGQYLFQILKEHLYLLYLFSNFSFRRVVCAGEEFKPSCESISY